MPQPHFPSLHFLVPNVWIPVAANTDTTPAVCLLVSQPLKSMLAPLCSFISYPIVLQFLTVACQDLGYPQVEVSKKSSGYTTVSVRLCLLLFLMAGSITWGCPRTYLTLTLRSIRIHEPLSSCRVYLWKKKMSITSFQHLLHITHLTDQS